ncbi:aryldialkylphosphatase [Acetobacter senegalensis]|uniref:Aryldialkylphosphatase n=1 Tax=Acetobacter senegalensis TaxID=446692 RepID=A0A149TYP4_9PROT|nr:phosphotriesterase-related protein [Acetobacter senegalensis]KXV58345.1 aryldialkylphosphatase [Acetobacter senegalensis]
MTDKSSAMEPMSVGVRSGRIMTVNGPVNAGEMGVTLVHEHILLDASKKWSTSLTSASCACHSSWSMRPLSMDMLGEIVMNPLGNRDNCMLDNAELAVEELKMFHDLGGRTVIDPTNVGIGRDPATLQKISQQTGLNIVMGAGYYLQPSHPDYVHPESTDQLARRIIQDVGGAERTDDNGNPSVLAGVIGEIGISSVMTKDEEKVLRAAAIASAETSVPLSVHLPAWMRVAHTVLDIAEEEGADLDHVILCHMNPSFSDPDYQHSLADRGAFLEYDMISMSYYYPEEGAQCPSDDENAKAITRLFERGYGKKLLISHDVFLKSMLTRYGGHGYGYILRHFVPRLKRCGLQERDIEQLLVSNPRRVMCGGR